MSRTDRKRVWGQLVLGIVLPASLLLAGPIACLSDVEVPDCERHGPGCGPDGGESAGAGGTSAQAGIPELAGEAGLDGGAAGSVVESAGSTGDDAGIGGSMPRPNVLVAGSGGVIAGSGGATAGAGGAAPVDICPFCRIVPTVLPAPCGSAQYTTELSVSGGVAPYSSWQLASAAGDWSVSRDPTSADGSKAILTGHATVPTSLTIDVTDSARTVAQITYLVQPRRSCLFAYTAVDAGGPKLQLLDPVLGSPPLALAHNQGVYDFSFSPDGQFLVYRYGADATHPKGRHLSLLDLKSSTEQPLPFAEDAVTAFSWSPDSSTLAVAFVSGSIGYLGGVRLVIPTQGQRPQPVSLSAVAAYIDSNLYWVGGNYISFYAAVLLDPVQPGVLVPNAYNQQTTFFATLGATAFSAPQALSPDSYSSDIVLQPSDTGFFVITATDPFTYFDSVPPSGPQASHALTVLVSPSGHFSAELAGDQLQIFAARAGDLNDVTFTSAAGEGCPKPLAWAKSKERIACVANVQSVPAASKHGEVRIFDVESSPTLAMSPLTGYCLKDTSGLPRVTPCAALEYDYTEESSSVQARAFSPSGRWFAFTTGSADIFGDNYLYWADVSSAPSAISLKRKVSIETSDVTSTSPTALAFSSDENYLLLQRGNLLTAHDLNAAQGSGPSSQPTIVSSGLTSTISQATHICSEDFASAPDRWCGSAERTLPWLWAPDSRYAAYRGQGALTIIDFTQFSQPARYLLTAGDCGQQCASQFAFQP